MPTCGDDGDDNVAQSGAGDADDAGAADLRDRVVSQQQLLQVCARMGQSKRDIVTRRVAHHITAKCSHASASHSAVTLTW